MEDIIKGLAIGLVGGAIVGGKIVYDKTCQFYDVDPSEMVDYYRSQVAEKKAAATTSIKEGVSNITAGFAPKNNKQSDVTAETASDISEEAENNDNNGEAEKVSGQVVDFTGAPVTE